jgi:hypothetical protein
MRPIDFLEFRSELKPASGFQSLQFREIECLSGARDPRYLQVFHETPADAAALRARLAEPTLWDAFVVVLRSRGLPAAGPDELLQTIIRIAKRVESENLYELAEALLVEGRLDRELAELVVELPLLLVRDDRVGCVHLLELPLGRRVALKVLSDDLARDKAYVQAPPAEETPPKIEALLASVVETLCEETEASAPLWCRAVPSLREPWFPSGTENLKALALRESPIHFRKRSIFVLGNFLSRA